MDLFRKKLFFCDYQYRTYPDITVVASARRWMSGWFWPSPFLSSPRRSTTSHGTTTMRPSSVSPLCPNIGFRWWSNDSKSGYSKNVFCINMHNVRPLLSMHPEKRSIVFVSFFHFDSAPKKCYLHLLLFPKPCSDSRSRSSWNNGPWSLNWTLTFLQRCFRWTFMV